MKLKMTGRWWWRLSLRGFIFFCPSVGWSDSVCLFVCLCGTFSPHCEHAQCFLFLWAAVVFLPFFSFCLGICSSLDFILTLVLVPVRAHSLESFCWLPLIVFSQLKCVCSVSRRVLEHTSLFWLSVCMFTLAVSVVVKGNWSLCCTHTLDLDGGGECLSPSSPPFLLVTRSHCHSSRPVSERELTVEDGCHSVPSSHIEHWTGTTTIMYTTSWRALVFSCFQLYCTARVVVVGILFFAFCLDFLQFLTLLLSCAFAAVSV